MIDSNFNGRLEKDFDSNSTILVTITSSSAMMKTHGLEINYIDILYVQSWLV
jgi:hypothetical protein